MAGITLTPYTPKASTGSVDELAGQFGLVATQLEGAEGETASVLDTVYIPTETYIVKSGDTVGKVFTQLCPPQLKNKYTPMNFLAALKTLNPSAPDPSFNNLQVGQKITIPAFSSNAENVDYSNFKPPANQSITARGKAYLAATAKSIGAANTPSSSAIGTDDFSQGLDVTEHYEVAYDTGHMPTDVATAMGTYADIIMNFNKTNPDAELSPVENFQLNYMDDQIAYGKPSFGAYTNLGSIDENTLSALDQYYVENLAPKEAPAATSGGAPEKNQAPAEPPPTPSSSSEAQDVQAAAVKVSENVLPSWANNQDIADELIADFLIKICQPGSNKDALLSEEMRWPSDVYADYSSLQDRMKTLAKLPDSSPELAILKTDWDKFYSKNHTLLTEYKTFRAQESQAHGAGYDVYGTQVWNPGNQSLDEIITLIGPNAEKLKAMRAMMDNQIKHTGFPQDEITKITTAPPESRASLAKALYAPVLWDSYLDYTQTLNSGTTPAQIDKTVTTYYSFESVLSMTRTGKIQD